jgi:hypothetical protein
MARQTERFVPRLEDALLPSGFLASRGSPINSRPRLHRSSRVAAGSNEGRFRAANA